MRCELLAPRFTDAEWGARHKGIGEQWQRMRPYDWYTRSIGSAWITRGRGPTVLQALSQRMGLRTRIADQDWWAHGDAPVRVAQTLVPLVDGRAAMLAMCAAFLAAKESIWLADWDMHARLQMVRGHDRRAGKDGSPEQHALIARLRAAGLDDEAIGLWESGRLRVMDVLGFAARRGVDVHVLLWAPFNPSGLAHIINNPADQRRILEARGVHCRLDKSSRSPFHVAQALHQKCAVVDGKLAFAGGVDLTVEYDGDFDRWDTPSHPFESPERSTDLGPAPHPWHDAHILVSGPPAADVERNIRQRWDEATLPWWRRGAPPLRHLIAMYLPGGKTGDPCDAAPEATAPPPGAGPEVASAAVRVQVVRTIPPLTYRFAPAGIHGIAQAYIRAVRQAERFIYLESQYLWLENFMGIDVLRLGWRSHHMRLLLSELATAAERGVTIAVVLPDHPNCGRAFTDGGIAWLRERAPHAAAEGRLHFFCLGTSDVRAHDGLMRYRPIYVHAKVGIVDDRWATLGSANLNSRGMSHDAELNLAVLDADFARGLRMALWAEHAGALYHAHTGWPAPAALPLPKPLVAPREAGLMALVHPVEAYHIHPGGGAVGHALSKEDLMALEDPLAGIALLARCASANLERVRNGERLVGQILPYLPCHEGAAAGLTVDHERGLLDPLRQVREGVYVRHPRRYT